MKFTKIHDLVEENGRTIRENNLAINHHISIGSLVENIDEDSDYYHMRFYIVEHIRDCDGTPLYVLGNKSQIGIDLKEPENRRKLFIGFGEDSLKEIISR